MSLCDYKLCDVESVLKLRLCGSKSAKDFLTAMEYYSLWETTYGAKKMLLRMHHKETTSGAKKMLQRMHKAMTSWAKKMLQRMHKDDDAKEGHEHTVERKILEC